MDNANTSETYECTHVSSESDSLVCLKCYLEPKGSEEEKEIEESQSSDSCCEAIAQAKAQGFLPTRFRARKTTE